MADSKGVITVIGRKKLCKAHAGDGDLPAIYIMKLGDGGVDENGIPKAVTGNEIGLYNQVWETKDTSHAFIGDDETTCRYTATVGKGEATGKEISEMGLFDAHGDMIAYRTFMRKGKDEDIPQTYDMDEIF